MWSTRVGDGELTLVEGDLTQADVDVVVNAANSSLMGGGGVDGAIHRAGGPAILDECKRIVASRGALEAGAAVITTGGRLTARYVIHTVGPIWRGGREREPETLASAYTESLRLAQAHKLRRVAFPSISTGAYGYPLQLASEVALRTVRDELSRTDALDEVRFVLFHAEALRQYTASAIRLFEGGRLA
jgi:O-acetyl-ADP-ribose deacetylase (regulator of RNase III)